MEVTRTFDILDWNLANYERDDAIAGKYGKEWRKWSTTEYRNDVNYVSYALLSMGLKKGDKVATITGNRPEWNLVDMALSQAGMIHVPVYPTISTEEYDYILKHSEVKIIFI